MRLSKSTSCASLGPLLATVALVAVGCSASEDPILQKYFQASRLRDNTTLGNIATVTFDPREDGQVQTFTVMEVSPERTQQLRLRDLAKEHDEARAADEEFTKRKKAYQDANLDAIDRVLKSERQKTALKGKDAALQAAWAKWRDETAQHSKRLSAARTKLAAERGIAELSASTGRDQIDATQYDGELLAKNVTINARVRTPDGQVADKTLIVTLQKARLKRNNQQDLNGRWIVTRIEDKASGTTKTT